MTEINLTSEQREFMVEQLIRRAENLVESFVENGAAATERLIRLQTDLKQHTDLIAELRCGAPVSLCELLLECVRSSFDDFLKSSSYEQEGLELLQAGRWEYGHFGPGTAGERQQMKQELKRIIDDDLASAAIAGAILRQVGEPVAA